MSSYSNIRNNRGTKPRTAHEHYLQRRERRQRNADGDGTVQGIPTIEDIADHENLLHIFKKLKREAGKAPGPDSVTYKMLSDREAAGILRDLSKSITDGSFSASSGRRVSIPKTGGNGHRTLTLRSIMFRVVAAALNESLSPYWENVFLDSSYGFRPNRNTIDMLLAMEQTIIQQGRFVIVTDDIRNAFDHVDIDILLDDHRKHFQDPELLRLIETILRGHTHEDRSIGIDQGSAYSPTALNVYVHHALDLPSSRDATNPPLFRYADNTVWLGRSVREGLTAQRRAQESLRQRGMSLKGEDPIVDLRKGQQAQLLGFVLRLENDRVFYGLGGSAWNKLTEELKEAHRAENPPQMATEVIRGWIEAFGPAFEVGTGDVPDRILACAAETGFPGLPREQVEQSIVSSRDRWLAKRKDFFAAKGENVVETVLASPPADADLAECF